MQSITAMPTKSLSTIYPIYMQVRYLRISSQLFQRPILPYTSSKPKPRFIQQHTANRRYHNMAPAMHGHSEACCSIPPIISKGYEPKGKYETIGGLKTYVTGPANASKAIFYIMDIFGYFPQSLQGADILSTSDEHNQYQVFMPDWFDGKPADISW